MLVFDRLCGSLRLYLAEAGEQVRSKLQLYTPGAYQMSHLCVSAGLDVTVLVRGHLSPQLATQAPDGANPGTGHLTLAK